MATNISNTAGNWLDQYSPLASFFGTKPETIQWDPMNLREEQYMALMQNIRNWPQVQQLGNLYQDYILGGLGRAGYGDIQGTVGRGVAGTNQLLDTAQSYLKGELPKDVQDEIYRNAAYGNVIKSGGGANYLMGSQLRDFGMNTMQAQQTGANMLLSGGNAAQQWNQLARSTMMDPNWAMVSPMERANWDFQQKMAQHNTQQAAANIAAQANPTASGLLQLAMTYYGGGMGGMGGGAGGGAAGAAGGAGAGAGAGGMGGMASQYAGMMGGGGGGSSGNIGGKGFYSGVPQAPLMSVGGGMGGMGGPTGSTVGMGFGSSPVQAAYMPTNTPGISNYASAFGTPSAGYDPYSTMSYQSNFPAQGAPSAGADLWNANLGNIWGG
jgi:hypothetical protein